MPARSLLTMRARLSRNTATGADAYGQPLPLVWVFLRVVPCHARHVTEKAEALVNGDVSIAHADLVLLFPLADSPVSGERVDSIEDRRGRVLFAGPFLAVTPFLRRRSYVQARLRMIGGSV